MGSSKLAFYDVISNAGVHGGHRVQVMASLNKYQLFFAIIYLFIHSFGVSN